MFTRHTLERLYVYLIPMLLGVAGILWGYSMAAHSLPRALTLLVSLFVPLAAGGNLLARYQDSTAQRFLVRAGVLVGVGSIALAFSGLTHVLVDRGAVVPEVGYLIELVSLVLLVVGTVVVASAVVRTGEGLTEYGWRFWHLAEHLDEGFLLTSRHGKVLSANAPMLHFLGRTREQVIGRNALDVAEEAGVEGVREHWTMRHPGVATEFEVNVHRVGEDRRFWVKGQPVYDPRGRHRGNLASVRDITDYHQLRERVERYAQGLQELVEQQTQRLVRSEERFRQLLVSMNEGFLTIDADHVVRFANARICQLLHMPEQALVGEHLLDFIDVPDRARFLEVLAQKERLPREDSRIELDFVNRDGEPVPAVMAVAYIPGSGEEAPVHSLVVTGVGELKRMQRQLERRAQELEGANEELRAFGKAKDSFLTNVSHELRTPLSTIQGYVEMLEAGTLGDLEPAQLGAVQVMRRNVTRTIGHINEMIDFSRMEIRGVELNMVLFSVERLVQDAVASIHPHAAAVSIDVTVDCPEGLPPVWGDRDKLSQVMGNILGNAVKFTGRDGAVTVAVGVRDTGTLTIAVRDTGIGIDPQVQHKVFDKFFQADGSMTRRYEGTGIGLSIAQSIVHAHGGGIELESAPGEGATFTVVLPNALFDMHFDAARHGAIRNSLVFCMNRNLAFREVANRVLGACGCLVEHAEQTGHQGVRRAEEVQPDLVIINGQGEDGAWQETVGLLREHPALAALPVVLFLPEGKALETARTSGDGVYAAPKPFTAQALADVVLQAFMDEPKPAPPPRPAQEAAPQAPARVSVLVLDGDPGLLEWVELALTSRGVLCHTATEPREALALAAAHTPDLLLLDLDVAGARAAEHLALFRDAPEMEGVAICAMSGVSDGPPGLRGAVAVLQKPFSLEDLLNVAHGPLGLSTGSRNA